MRPSVTFSHALASNIEGDHAYVVVPGAIAGSMKGKVFRTTGRVTAVLQHVTAGWKIAAFTWSDAPR